MASNGHVSSDLPFNGTAVNVGLNYSSPPTDGQPGVLTIQGTGSDTDELTGYYFVYQSQADEEQKPLTNIGQKAHDCTIQDLRGHERTPTLDTHGFQFVDAGQSKELEFADDEKVKEGPYTRECEQILFKATDAKKVVIFDYTIRRQGGVEGPLKRQPVPKVHVDQSKAAAERRVRVHCPDEAEELLKGRYRIVNLWRPLIEGSPVQDIPLALADYRTIADDDFFEVKRVAPERTGETLGVRYNERHRWYYLSDQRHDEATLIKVLRPIWLV